MSDNTFKKSPTAFLQNRLSMNRLIQNGSKKRIEKEIEYFKADDVTVNGPDTPHPHPAPVPDPYAGSDFHGNNSGLDMQVDGNSAVLAGNCPYYNPNRFKSGAKLRVKTPGFRENSAVYEDAFYSSDARPQGKLSSTCGLAPHFVKTLVGETLQLDQATLLKVSCGTVPIMLATITSGNVSKFLACSDMHSGNDYLTWTDGTNNNYYTHSHYGYYKGSVLYSNTTLTTAAGLVNACYVDEPQTKPMLAGMFRSTELDETVGQTNYYGWFFINSVTESEFTQVYTTSEKPEVDSAIYHRNVATGTYIQFPTSVGGVTGAGIKVANWSAPATMFDVDYEFDYVQGGDIAVVDELSLDKDTPHLEPASTHFHYNLRALINGYGFYYPIIGITVTDGGDPETTLGTFTFDTYYNNYHVRWKNTDTAAAVQYVYTYSEDDWNVYSDENLDTWYGVSKSEGRTIGDTPEEYVMYMAYSAYDGDYTNPETLTVAVNVDYTSTNRREMLISPYFGVDLTPYITQKWWNTANLGYGEVSSQTTLYTETVYRYKDLDAHLKQYLPATWEGNAYGCIIVSDSSADKKGSGYMFLGVSHTDFFQDGSDVYYIIPTNIVGDAGENGPYDLIHAYVYDAALNSIYSTNFAIDSTSGSTTVTHHYISDATHNYQVGGNWRYHYACVEDKNQDIWAKRLAYDFSDLYYLVNGEEEPLNPDTQTLVTPQLFPYSTLYTDRTNNENGVTAWYDFYHMDITQVTGFAFTSTIMTNNITVTPTGGSVVTANRSMLNDRWDGFEHHYCWVTTNSVYIYSNNDYTIASGDALWDYDGQEWGTVTTIGSVTREAWRYTDFDTTKTTDDVTIPMYCWQFYTDPTYPEGGNWTLYTDTPTLVVGTTHLWADYGGWSDTNVSPSSLVNSPITWYRFHTSIKETYVVNEETHETAERFKVVWANNRNPYEYPTVVESNYAANNPLSPTSPNFSSTISYEVENQCYIAPAYQLVITYQGTDYTYTVSYSQHNPSFQGILCSGWVCEGVDYPILFTARITPHVGDKLYYIEADGTHVAEGCVIKEVKSVVDFIYTGRA